MRASLKLIWLKVILGMPTRKSFFMGVKACFPFIQNHSDIDEVRLFSVTKKQSPKQSKRKLFYGCESESFSSSFIRNHSRTASWQTASTSSTATASLKPSSSAASSAPPTLPPEIILIQIDDGDYVFEIIVLCAIEKYRKIPLFYFQK